MADVLCGVVDSIAQADACIAESEKTLGMLGYGEKLARLKEGSLAVDEKRIAIVPSWERLCMEAERAVGTGIELESIFTEEELQANDQALSALRREYNQIHHLDKYDIGISVAAGLLGAAVDILLVGIPKKGPDGITAGISVYFRIGGTRYCSKPII